MNTREQLAEVIRDGVGVWRTPLEAADAILDALSAGTATTVTYGLRHPNGYVFETKDRQYALDLKSGAIIQGRRGAWSGHELVKREHRTQVTAWEATE